MTTVEDLQRIVSEMEAIIAEGKLHNPKMRDAIAKLAQWNEDYDPPRPPRCTCPLCGTTWPATYTHFAHICPSERGLL